MSKGKATLLLFLRKAIVSNWLLREIFLKNAKQCVELWTRVLRFWSASQFYVVAFLFLICRNHKTYYNCSILLTKSGSRHCTLQRNYNAVPHESGREDIAEFLSNLFTTGNNPVQLKRGRELSGCTRSKWENSKRQTFSVYVMLNLSNVTTRVAWMLSWRMKILALSACPRE